MQHCWKMPRLIATIVACGLLHLSARADETRNGNVLLQYCTATIGAYVDFCYGYIDAVADQMLAHAPVAGFTACIPATADDPALRARVVAFLRENEGLHTLMAPELIARAFSQNFPCR
jgi:hypothetical protein